MQLLASYASLSIAFIARPLGSIVFGHFGDRIGRKSTLVVKVGFRNANPALPALHKTTRVGPG